MQLFNTHNTYKKFIVPATVFLVGTILIWCITPLISWHGHAPFAHASKRLYLILLGAIAIVAKVFFVDLKKNRQHKISLPSINPEFDRKIHVLEGQVEGVVKFLKETVLTHDEKKIKLSNLPWYLVIGTQDSGKTTLLANSNINYILKEQIHLDDIKNISTSDHCGWWVTQDAVLIDVPSDYLNQASSSNPLWQSFLTLIKKFGEKSLNGVIIALPVSQLAEKTQHYKLEKLLRERVDQLRDHLGEQLPFYFAITKCDLLPGFSDFFSDCGSDELGQAWGINIPNAEHENITHLFTQRFNALIKRLNKQLIWRLHQERDFSQRIHIKNFPLQVERLKENLLTLIQALSKEDSLCLQGVYLTSALQQEADAQFLQNLPINADHVGQALQIMHKPPMPSRSYFIRQFILQGLNKPTVIPFIGRNWQQQPTVYVISGIAIIFMLVFISYDMHSSPTLNNKHLAKASHNSVMAVTRNQGAK